MMLLTASTSLSAQRIPAGATLSVRVLDSLSSDGSQRGALVRAVVLVPLLDGSRVLVAPRVQLEGRVDSAGTDRAKGARHFLDVRFTALRLDDGTRVPISARVTSVDNARESVDARGRILGPPRGGVWRSTSSWAALALGAVSPIAAGVLFGTIREVESERHRRIVFPSGTDMTVKLDTDVPLSSWATFAGPEPVAADAAVKQLIASLPLRSEAAAGRTPGDFINIIFVGTQDAVRTAFLDAGWDVPDRMSTTADFETFIRAASARGFAHQPVSRQTLFDRAPDLVFQRVTDTFAKRHHVRLWRRGETWNGEVVWAAAATHDVGIAFSRAHRGFTHQTDPAIDGERDKVIGDLAAVQRVHARSLVLRDPAPDSTARGLIQSDWRVAVVRLRD